MTSLYRYHCPCGPYECDAPLVPYLRCPWCGAVMERGEKPNEKGSKE